MRPRKGRLPSLARAVVAVLVLALWGGPAGAYQVDLASGTSEKSTFGGAAPGTWAAEVTVVSPGDLAVEALVLYGLKSGPIQVGARIYDASDGSLVATSQVATNLGGALVVPVAATLRAGATYRLGLYLGVDSSLAVQVAFFDPPPQGLPVTPYVDTTGSLRVERPVYSFLDEYPFNTLVGAMPVMGLLVEGMPPVTLSGPAWDTRAGLPGFNGDVLALAVFDNGTGPALYAGGNFTQAGGVAAGGIARWNGVEWSPLQGGGIVGTVNALAVFDEGGGPELYAAGTFTSAGGVAVNNIAKWDEVSWKPVGSGLVRTGAGLSPVVNALAVWNDGSGPALYAGGSFTASGATPLARIGRWKSGAWSAVGAGVTGPTGGGGPRVKAILGFPGTLGIPPSLYVGGVFDTAGSTPAKQVARWDGLVWWPLGNGLQSDVGPAAVNSLIAFDEGAGPRIFAGGSFTAVGNDVIGLFGVGRWDGLAWSGLSVGLDGGSVNALAAFDDGSGPALFAGGLLFNAVNLDPPVVATVTPGIARWSDGRWSHVARGVARLAPSNAQVNALAPWDDGTGLWLFAGGRFSFAGGEPVQNFAAWGLANRPPVADAGEDRTIEVGEFCSAVQPALDGSGSSDPDLNPLTYRWTGDFGEADGAQPTVALGLGVHEITLTVDDGRGGMDTDTVTITVADVSPPGICVVIASPGTLSPANHKFVPVVFTVGRSDNCDSYPACRITNLTSNESDGGGGSGPDWIVTGDLTADFRAERDGNGTGRIYQATIECADDSGNAATAIGEVSVPRRAKGRGGSSSQAPACLTTSASTTRSIPP